MISSYQDTQQRIIHCAEKVGTLIWLQTLDDARHQLVEETNYTYAVPVQLVAERACDIIESNV